MERLSISEQQFIIELIKRISINSNLIDVKETTNKKRNPQESIKKFIENINAITDEPLDEEFDKIIKSGIYITRELDL